MLLSGWYMNSSRLQASNISSYRKVNAGYNPWAHCCLCYYFCTLFSFL